MEEMWQARSERKQVVLHEEPYRSAVLKWTTLAERVSALDWLSLRLCGNHYVAGFASWLVLLSKALYHTCFICGQRCKWWSHWPKLTLSVISDVKPIIYILPVAKEGNAEV